MTSKYYVVVNSEREYLKALLLLNRHGFTFSGKEELLDVDPEPLLKTYPNLCLGIDYLKRRLTYSPKEFYENEMVEKIKFNELEQKLHELSREDL
jgi:hypothetical protein